MAAKPSANVKIPADTYAFFEGEAADIDVPTSWLINAVLLGAANRGIVASLMERSLERKLVQPHRNRRPRPQLPWESDGENWHYEGWTLVRKGDRNHSERTKLPGEGWYLFGPSQPEDGSDLGTMSATKAKDRANDIIDLLRRRSQGGV